MDMRTWTRTMSLQEYIAYEWNEGDLKLVTDFMRKYTEKSWTEVCRLRFVTFFADPTMELPIQPNGECTLMAYQFGIWHEERRPTLTVGNDVYICWDIEEGKEN